jgi:hypothetical protein
VDDPAIMRWLMRRYTHTPGKWTETNQSFGGPTGHQGTQRWQGSGPKRFSKEGPETFT